MAPRRVVMGSGLIACATTDEPVVHVSFAAPFAVVRQGDDEADSGPADLNVSHQLILRVIPGDQVRYVAESRAPAKAAGRV